MTAFPARLRLAAVAVALGAVLIVPAGCGTGESHGDYPAYASSAELIDKADLVVCGVPLRSRSGKLWPDVATGSDPQANPQAGLPSAEADAAREDGAIDITITTVRLDEVFKGAGAPGDLIEVSRPAGERALPAAKSGCVLFLAAYEPGVPHDLLNPDAVYTVADGGALTPGGPDAPPLATIDELRSATR